MTFGESQAMKTFFALVVLLCGNVRANPIFVGMLDAAKDGMFFAVSPSEGRPSKWVTIGESIDGFFVSDYRARSEQLVLTKDEKTFVLALKKSIARPAAPFVDETSVRELAKKIIARWDGWDLSTSEVIVWFKNDWNVVATRVTGGKKETRIISVPDGFAMSASK